MAGRRLGAARRSMLSHRTSVATTPEASHKPPTAGFSGFLALSRSLTDATASLCGPLLASKPDRAGPIGFYHRDLVSLALTGNGG
jgi:hypothetical protein